MENTDLIYSFQRGITRKKRRKINSTNQNSRFPIYIIHTYCSNSLRYSFRNLDEIQGYKNECLKRTIRLAVAAIRGARTPIKRGRNAGRATLDSSSAGTGRCFEKTVPWKGGVTPRKIYFRRPSIRGVIYRGRVHARLHWIIAGERDAVARSRARRPY